MNLTSLLVIRKLYDYNEQCYIYIVKIPNNIINSSRQQLVKLLKSHYGAKSKLYNCYKFYYNPVNTLNEIDASFLYFNKYSDVISNKKRILLDNINKYSKLIDAGDNSCIDKLNNTKIKYSQLTDIISIRNRLENLSFKINVCKRNISYFNDIINLGVNKYGFKLSDGYCERQIKLNEDRLIKYNEMYEYWGNYLNNSSL